MAIIEVRNLTKEYRLGALRGLKDTLRNLPARIARRPVEKPKVFKALDDLTLEVECGEVLGIIGSNGAGKSTLLKMLAGISTPTHGYVRSEGKISPLIEVGAGFIPDFTGRENVYLNGSILGMSRKQIAARFEEIVDFAEMSQFIDTPVKRYSSGMQVKLAFAVATSVDSDILIVDEVMAVGDLAFQRKCYDRIEEFIRRGDRTILLVSHNLRQVQRLCSRAICISAGQISVEGDPVDVCNAFFEQSNRLIASNRAKTHGRFESSRDFELLSVTLINDAGEAAEIVTSRSDVEVEIGFRIKKVCRDVVFTLGLHTTDLFFIAVTGSDEQIFIEQMEPCRYTIKCRLPSLPIKAGIYAIHFAAETGPSNSPLFRGDNLLSFQVLANKGEPVSINSARGVLALETDWFNPEKQTA